MNTFELPDKPKTERPESPNAELESLLSRNLEKALNDKISSTLKRLVDSRFEQYFEKTVSKNELDQAAEQLFSLMKEGKPAAEILDELRRVASDIAARTGKGIGRNDE